MLTTIYSPAPSWPTAPADVRLDDDEVHVWCAVLERPPHELARMAELLSDDERQRVERSRSPMVRREFTAARALLRTLLGYYLCCDSRSVRFRSGPQGKPELADCPWHRPVHFNVSHSHGLALFAITVRGAVGVDVEMLRPFNALGMAERYFSPWEFHALRSLDEAVRGEAFFHTWTRKEAFLKATGGGIAYGLERVEVVIHPHETARILRLDGDETRAHRWSLRTLHPAPGYVGALALETHEYRLITWHGPHGGM
jgi:4'-phosphopantetheinyl transferase